MAAYIIGNVTITDPVAYKPYTEQVPALVAAHGGLAATACAAARCRCSKATPRRTGGW
jgi:uncharacterized protein (DUF1330 family)